MTNQYTNSWSTFADGTSTNTYATITGLEPNTKYLFRINAVNAMGTNTNSFFNTTIGTTASSAPTGLTVGTTAPTSIQLTWTAPNTGALPITDYVTQYRTPPATGSWSTFADGTSTTASTTVTNLTPNTSYEFQVAAVTDAGTGAYSSTTTKKTLVATGPYICGDTGSVTYTSIKVCWPPTSGATDYVIRYKLTSDTSWTTFPDGTSTTTSATVTGLTAGTSYDFQVAAVTSGTTGPYSNTVTQSTLAVTLPGAPTGLTPGTATSSTMPLTWTAPTNNGGSDITGYVIQHRTSAVGTTPAGVWIYHVRTTTPGTTTSETVTSLLHSTSHDFQVAAKNSAGIGPYSDIATKSTLVGTNTVPDYPHGLVVYPNSYTDSGARFAFWASDHNGGYPMPPNYLFTTKLNTTCTIGQPVWSADGTKAEITLTTAASNNKYEVSVYANNNKGNSIPTNKVCIVTKPVTPTGLSITSFDSDSVSLSWNSQSGNQASKLKYIVQYRQGTSGPWTTDDSNVSGTTHTVDGLTARTGYSFQVAAKNDGGTSAYTSSVSGGTWTIPDYPHGLAVYPNSYTDSGARFAFWASDHNGGLPMPPNYRFNTAPNTTCTIGTQVWSAEAVKVNKTLSTAASNTKYEVSVYANNRIGDSIPTNKVCIVTEPATPVGVTATNPTSSSVHLGWNTQSGNQTPKYIVQYKLSSSNAWLTHNNNVSSTVYTVTGLSGSTTYDFRVAAKNDGGTSAYSSKVSNTTLPAGVPGKPTGVTIGTTTSTTIALSWTAPSNSGSSIITDYRIWVSPPGQIPYIFNDGVSASTSATVTGLTVTPGSYHGFKVAAKNNSGWGQYSTLAWHYQPLVTSSSSTSISLSWPDVAGEDATYMVEYRTPPGTGTWTTFSTGVSGTSETITGLNPDTEYEFRVTVEAASTASSNAGDTYHPGTVTGRTSANSEAVS